MEPAARVSDEPLSNGNGQVSHEPVDPVAQLESPAGEFTCPECGTAFTPDTIPADNVLVCPSCNAQFFPPAAYDAEQAEAEAEDRLREEEEARRREDEIDQAKYKQVLAYRRGLNRTRSLYIVFMVVLFVIAGQLLVKMIGRPWDRWSYVMLFIALASVLGALTFPKKMAAVNRELDQTKQRDPEREPDFSTLSDGSERWKAIESMGQSPPQGDAPPEDVSNRE